MASFLIAVLAFCVVISSAPVSGSRGCSIKRYGKLKMFSGELGNVELPCKYRLADLTCGDFHIKVTVGSSMDPDTESRFSPDTMWVKVTNRYNGLKWIGRTASGLIREANTSSVVWTEKEGDLTFDVEAFNADHKRAQLSVDDVFEVFFSSGQDDDGAKVTCHVEDMTSKPYPESLCGLRGRDPVLNARKVALFGDAPGLDDQDTKARALTHDILTNNQVQQSKLCQGVARRFRQCGGHAAEAAKVCGPVFGSRPLSKCLGGQTSNVQHFDQCVTSVCTPGVVSACVNLKAAIRDRCAEEMSAIPGLRC